MLMKTRDSIYGKTFESSFEASKISFLSSFFATRKRYLFMSYPITSHSRAPQKPVHAPLLEVFGACTNKRGNFLVLTNVQNREFSHVKYNVVVSFELFPVFELSNKSLFTCIDRGRLT